MAQEKLYWDRIRGSSNIRRSTWVPEEHPEADGGNMYIVFTNRWMYVFYEVPPEVYDSFMDAPSKGKYFHQNIRNKYDYDRLGQI